MRAPRPRFTVVLFSCCLATTMGCGEDPPTDREYDEIASEVAPLVTQDFRQGGAFEIAAGLADGEVPDWVAKDSTGSFEGNHAGFDWVIELNCMGEGDPPIGDPSQVDAMSLCLTANGWLDLPHFAAELNAEKQWAIRGLQTDTLELEGNCQLEASSTFESPIRPVTRSSELEIQGNHSLAIPKADPPAATGSIRLAVNGECVRTDPNGDQLRQVAVDVEVTLDGSGIALIVIDGVATYELDLRTGTLARL